MWQVIREQINFGKIMEYIRKTVALFGIFGALLLAAPALIAQDDSLGADPNIEEAVVAETGGEAIANVTLMDRFQQGGFAMWPLLALSICTFALILYNGLMIRKKPFLREDLQSDLKEAFSELDFERASQICEENPSVFTNIVSAGLERIDPEHLDPQDVKEGIEEASADELSAPFGMISYLSSIATISPMIGLLGTVSGMVQAFGSISEQGMGQAQVLAGNINEALITTASGLIVALFAMVPYLIFKNRFAKISSGVSRQLGDLFFEMIKALRRAA